MKRRSRHRTSATLLPSSSRIATKVVDQDICIEHVRHSSVAIKGGTRFTKVRQIITVGPDALCCAEAQQLGTVCETLKVGIYRRADDLAASLPDLRRQTSKGSMFIFGEVDLCSNHTS